MLRSDRLLDATAGLVNAVDQRKDVFYRKMKRNNETITSFSQYMAFEIGLLR